MGISYIAKHKLIITGWVVVAGIAGVGGYHDVVVHRTPVSVTPNVQLAAPVNDYHGGSAYSPPTTSYKVPTVTTPKVTTPPAAYAPDTTPIITTPSCDESLRASEESEYNNQVANEDQQYQQEVGEIQQEYDEIPGGSSTGLSEQLANLQQSHEQELQSLQNNLNTELASLNC